MVQPDGTVASGGALVGGAAATQADGPDDADARDSQAAGVDRISSADRTSADRVSTDRASAERVSTDRSSVPTPPAHDALSDTAQTIPLPSLAELGLSGIGVGQGAAPIPLAGRAASAATSAVPLPPPPPTSGARSLGPPPPPGSRDSGVGMVAGEPPARLSAPPSAAGVQATDLDDDDDLKPTVFNQQAVSLDSIVGRPGPGLAAAPAAGQTPSASRAPWSGPTAVRVSERLAATARASVARVKQAPLTQRGWSILGAIVLGGIIVGAIVAPDAEEGPKAPFDETSARQALSDAVAQARHCFSRPIPALVGVVDAQFAPSGEATSVEVSGGLTHVDEHRCIADAFNAMRVAPFSGPPVRTKKTVSLSFDR